MAIDDCMISFGIVCRLRRLAAAWRETEEAAKTCDIWYDIDEHVHGTLLLCYPNKQIISTSKRECVCNKKPKIIEDYKKSIKIRSRKEKRSKTKMSFSFETKCFAAAAASEKGRCVSRVDINLLHRKTFLFAWWFSFTYLLLSTTFKSPAPFSFCFLLLLLPRGV